MEENKEYHQSLDPVSVLPRGWSGAGVARQRTEEKRGEEMRREEKME